MAPMHMGVHEIIQDKQHYMYYYVLTSNIALQLLSSFITVTDRCGGDNDMGQLGDTAAAQAIEED